jgi:hypothetical protein
VCCPAYQNTRQKPNKEEKRNTIQWFTRTSQRRNKALTKQKKKKNYALNKQRIRFYPSAQRFPFLCPSELLRKDIGPLVLNQNGRLSVKQRQRRKQKQKSARDKQPNSNQIQTKRNNNNNNKKRNQNQTKCK